MTLTKRIDYHPKFFKDKYYHIYNRAVGTDKLFFHDENYKYFLNKYKFFLNDVIQTYAFCLLPNHFHLLIKPKINESETIIEKFRKFFISYSMAINKEQARKGNLFQSNFKRKIIENEKHLIQAVYYIHANPINHMITNDFQNYRYSSYKKIIGQNETSIGRKEVLIWFGGLKNFVEYHKEINQSIFTDHYSIEDI